MILPTFYIINHLSILISKFKYAKIYFFSLETKKNDLELMVGGYIYVWCGSDSLPYKLFFFFLKHKFQLKFDLANNGFAQD